MRHSGDWMTLVDDRVLEYIAENGSGSPNEMKNEGPIQYSRVYIHERCKKLVEEGLLNHLGNGIYTITDDGEKYLSGDLDTQNWIYLDEETTGSVSMDSERQEG